jgi:hypothetical protein
MISTEWPMRAVERQRLTICLRILPRAATLAGVTVGQVWAHRAAPDGDEGAAALARPEAFPLADAVISADAGPLRPPFVQKVVEQKGVLSG